MGLDGLKAGEQEEPFQLGDSIQVSGGQLEIRAFQLMSRSSDGSARYFFVLPGEALGDFENLELFGDLSTKAALSDALSAGSLPSRFFISELLLQQMLHSGWTRLRRPPEEPVGTVRAEVEGGVAPALLSLDEKPATSFAPVDGDWVSAPLYGMGRHASGQNMPMVFSGMKSRRSDCVYRVSIVTDEDGSSVYHFTHPGSAETSPLKLGTPDQVYRAFRLDAKFPRAFSVPVSLIGLLARQEWTVISSDEAAKRMTPPAGGAASVVRPPVALEPAASWAQIAPPVLPLALPPSEPDSTGVTRLQPPEVLGLRPVQDVDPESLVPFLEGLVGELEGFATRPSELIKCHDIQRVVGQLMPRATGGQIPDALHARLRSVQKILIDKNNAYDRIVKGISVSADREKMDLQLKEIAAAVRCVGGLMVAIHEKRAPKRGFLSKFFRN